MERSILFLNATRDTLVDTKGSVIMGLEWSGEQVDLEMVCTRHKGDTKIDPQREEALLCLLYAPVCEDDRLLTADRNEVNRSTL